MMEIWQAIEDSAVSIGRKGIGIIFGLIALLILGAGVSSVANPTAGVITVGIVMVAIMVSIWIWKERQSRNPNRKEK